MSNLLSNAAKFSNEDNEVEISISSDDTDQVQVSIHNEGSGIPLEYHQKIFSKFFQADASDTRNVGGTGLGLSICKAIVDNMCGYIDFESAAGHCATFYFKLPILDSEHYQHRDQNNKLAG